MKLATLRSHHPDGRLVVVSHDQTRALDAGAIATSLLDALQRWDDAAPALQALAHALDGGDDDARAASFAFDAAQCAAPLPRGPQWLDGSAFLNHGRLMERAFNSPPIPLFDSVPVMYQGASDDFLGPHDDVPLPSEADGIDFEGEFGVVVGPVPMAATPAQALAAVRLVVQINDWSLRALGPHEMKTGFGFLQAKPSTAFAPIAVTPDELGSAWADGRVAMDLRVTLNGERFGEPNGREMNFGFGELVAHAARTRRLTAGTVVGSGTVSNVARSAGSACLAERRVIEMIDEGQARTPFMRFGDRVRMEAVFAPGQAPGPGGSAPASSGQAPDGVPAAGPFGVVDQRVVAAGVGASAG